MQPGKSSQHVVNSAGKISVINGFGFLSALLVDIVLARRFGLGQETDALFIALTLPQLIASILLVTVNVALVPLFTRMLLEYGKQGLWNLTSNLINLALLVFIPIGVIGSLISPSIVTLLGIGLEQTTKNLAIELSTFLFLMIIPMGAVEVIKATLNALHSFAYPAATNVIKNLTILLIIFFIPSLNIRVVAISYVIATFVQLAFLIIILQIKGFRYKFWLHLKDEWTKKALIQLRYPLAGEIMGQGNIIVERFLASFLPVGVVSALGYARRILRGVDSIFLGSVTAAFLPHLAVQSANNDSEKYRNTVTSSIKLLAFISLPLTALVIGLSESIIQILFERGAFTVNDTHATTLFLNVYMISLPAWAIFQALQTAYYSSGDTKRPFLFRAITFLLNLVLNGVLFILLRAPGLAIALVLARITVTVVSASMLHHRIKIIDSNMVSFLVRMTLASVLLGAVTLVSRGQFAPFLLAPNHANLLDMLLRAGIGSLIFIFSLLVLQVQEALILLQQIKIRLRPS